MNDQTQGNGTLGDAWEAIDRLEKLIKAAPTGANELRLGPNLVLHGTPQQRVAFFAALAKAQAAYEPIERSRTVEVRSDKGAYTFDYAPLEEVISATQPALNANGIAWLCVPTEGALHTMLTHADGAMLHSVEPLPAFDSPQKYGSALTYRRRYGYQCLTGTAPEYDDDGNEAAGNKVQAVAPRNRQPPSPQGRTVSSATSGGKPITPTELVTRGVQRSAEPAPKPVAPTPAQATSPTSVSHTLVSVTPAQAAPSSLPPPAPDEVPPAEVVDVGPATVVGSAPEPDEDDGRPCTQDQTNAIIQLCKARKWDRVALNKYIAERIDPAKNHTTLTFADAAALIEMLSRPANA